MIARNAFINSGSFLDSSTSLIKAFTVFHLYLGLCFSITATNTSIIFKGYDKIGVFQ